MDSDVKVGLEKKVYDLRFKAAFKLFAEGNTVFKTSK